MIETALQKTLGYGLKVFIEKAIAGGWRFTYAQFSYVQNINDAPNLILIDPAAWRAVGKTEGWNDADNPKYGEPSQYQHRFIDALNEGVQ